MAMRLGKTKFPREEFLNGMVETYQGSCLDVLPTLGANFFYACICDPPYHMQSVIKRFGKAGSAATKGNPVFSRHSRGFMEQQWDDGDVAFNAATWMEVHRVLRPGAFLMAFAGCRTYHKLACAAELAGFVTHPMIPWLFNNGFPKPHKVAGSPGWYYGGQTLAPGVEPIYVGQKPFEKGLTGSQNFNKWGVGAYNIDACRTDGQWPRNVIHAAKPSTDEKIGSDHPTIKPLELIQHLIRLVVPSNGVVLDPFAGTGTTGEAAWRERVRATLIEREKQYFPDIRRRMKMVLADPKSRRIVAVRDNPRLARNKVGLFG